MKLNRLPYVCLVILFACFGLAISEARSADASVSASPPPITAANVYDHEEYWPNIVRLTESWQPPRAGRALEKATQGVLVRVESTGQMRVDFGRHGKFEVPIEVSDLVERTNAVRAGSLHKTAPNFLLQIATRLIDSSVAEARAIKSAEISGADSFLVVFADPTDSEFWKRTRDLASLGDVNGLQAIFVPQSVDRGQTQAIKDKLRSSEWSMPFTYPRLSETYTRSLLESVPTEPHALLVTPEGRLLYRSDLSKPGVFDAIRAAALTLAPGHSAEEATRSAER